MRKTFTTTIDEDVQKNFKSSCAQNGVKMNDVLEAFMQGYVKGEFEIEKELKFTIKKTSK
ncbi:hypothetical protein OCI51_26440 (plasmid) [Lysinibacillus capsici]|uniref:hypothetical protein n=1 Tax=Lysinibacillus capsici TaxID=2115968 RepID=UPI0021DAAA6C|nr:hypothetical protein [Lysinibacillus capsici]UYB50150.1 hypothetical protein OCI51_26830 [Lysinibacillus capsici]UYB50224.1 hypothetical protein OCI51_26440 [Lysinibacillus capsici]